MKFVVKKKINEIEKEWNALYLSNADLSPYQSYEWNKNLYKRIHFLRTDSSRNNYLFVLYYRENTEEKKPSVIIPLVVPKDGEDICILGDHMKSGTLNFIYSDDISEEDFFNVFAYLKESYPNTRFRLFEIPKITALGAFLFKHEEMFQLFFQRESVRCELPPTVDELKQKLSKSVRQTIRTSYNRLQKDGLAGKLEIHYSYRFSIKERNCCNQLHNIRKKEWGYIIENENADSFTRIKQFVRDTLLDPFYMFSHHTEFVYVKYLISDQIAAFFIAIKNAAGYCIVPTLIHDRSFDFYSPGLLMIYEYLCHSIQTKEISIFDLSRGNESYKMRYLPQPETYTNGLFYFNEPPKA